MKLKTLTKNQAGNALRGKAVRQCLDLMRNPEQNSLFSGLACYMLDHDERGRHILLSSLPEKQRRRFIFRNLHLAMGMDFTQQNGFPILKPYQPRDIFYDFLSFKDRCRLCRQKRAVHFFAPDETFFNAVTQRLELTTAELVACDLVFAPDISLYVDAPEFINKQSVFLSRFAAAYWQQCGLNVIQTATWGAASSFNYCFEGLAYGGTTAVSGIGHQQSRAATELWQQGLRELESRVHPSMIIIYGGEWNTFPDIETPICYIADYITKHFRNYKTAAR